MSKKLFEINGTQYEYYQLCQRFLNISFPAYERIQQSNLPNGVALVIVADPT